MDATGIKRYLRGTKASSGATFKAWLRQAELSILGPTLIGSFTVPAGYSPGMMNVLIKWQAKQVDGYFTGAVFYAQVNGATYYPALPSTGDNGVSLIVSSLNYLICRLNIGGLSPGFTVDFYGDIFACTEAYVQSAGIYYDDVLYRME